VINQSVWRGRIGSLAAQLAQQPSIPVAVAELLEEAGGADPRNIVSAIETSPLGLKVNLLDDLSRAIVLELLLELRGQFENDKAFLEAAAVDLLRERTHTVE
jgi:hypothetical protein